MEALRTFRDLPCTLVKYIPSKTLLLNIRPISVLDQEHLTLVDELDELAAVI